MRGVGEGGEMNTNKIWYEIKSLNTREIVVNEILVKTVGVLSFVILTTLGAYVWIPLPFTPVPITLQTFFVLLSGAVLGANLGALSQFGYLLFGGLGLPLFAGGTFGLSSLIGPTGGYLLGFVSASCLVGWLTGKGKTRYINLFLIFVIASLVIYLLGASWLAIFLSCSLRKAIFLGILPFIPGDILKIVFATLVYKKIQLRTKCLFG